MARKSDLDGLNTFRNKHCGGFLRVSYCFTQLDDLNVEVVRNLRCKTHAYSMGFFYPGGNSLVKDKES